MAERRLDPERYRKAVAHADALRAIIPRFGEQKAFVRITEPITSLIRREMRSEAGIIGSNRDPTVCALVNKACNTHAAVRVLTDAGHGDDAMALGRVLLENAALLQWLLIDPIYRLDLYCISDALYPRAPWQSRSRGRTPGTCITRPTDQFYGDRNARFEDSFGNEWSVITHVKNVSEPEMKKAMAGTNLGANRVRAKASARRRCHD